jgi:stage II sporulation protein D
MNKQPVIHVGIQSKDQIEFSLSGIFHIDNKQEITGSLKAKIIENRIQLFNSERLIKSANTLEITPTDETNHFTLHQVTIGVNFHWERNEDQAFSGVLKLIIKNNKITAINVLPIEDYLVSVISSEMSATSSMELLKAHAVISRSWLIAQIEKNKSIKNEQKQYSSIQKSENELIKWYDREDHNNFDVCADDHCQRYQGISRSTTKAVNKAVKATTGEVLTYNSEICDARFSKCCGGIAETFENVWEPVHHPYLQKVVDNDHDPENFELTLENENNAKAWIHGTPEAFCNTNDKKVLSQVLNDYDQETNDFYRWKVEYDQDILSKLIKKRTGIDFGTITDLIPIKRGVSGRIIKLQIVGKKKTFIIGKELEIRKALSKSHLYSSAFVIKKEISDDQVKFILHGAGWGHGVGLCQIGAAMMSEKGHSYEQILKHYYKNATLNKRY